MTVFHIKLNRFLEIKYKTNFSNIANCKIQRAKDGCGVCINLPYHSPLHLICLNQVTNSYASYLKVKS